MSSDPWIRGYTRKSRHMDQNIPEEELFRQHRLSLLRKSEETRIPLPPEQISYEVGTSESVAERPVISRLLDEVDRMPRNAGGYLFLPDPDRLTRGDNLEQAIIYNRLQRAGIRLMCVIGGEIDLGNHQQEMFLHLKGLISRMLIQEYKAKVALTTRNQIENGETRYGATPWGYWQDKTEKLARDRIKPDRREEERRHAGLTPFEALQHICREVMNTPVRELAARYDVPASTLFTTLATPTICGYPAKKSYMDLDRPSKKNRQRKLPRDQWIWPKREGTYEAACSREEWGQIQEALARRRCGRVKWGGGEGVCRDVVTFEGLDRRQVVLARMGYAHGQPVPAYRFIARTGEQRDVEREPVDAAAREALAALFGDTHFFIFMIEQYYHRRKADPLPVHEETSQIEAILRRWNADLDNLIQMVRQADVRLLRERYDREAAKLAGMIEAKERELDEVRQRRSPIPEIDQAVPILLRLRDLLPPQQWGECWAEIWAELSARDQRFLVQAFIKTVPVRYAQRVKGARGTRELLAVEYVDFVNEARAEWCVVARLQDCSKTNRQSYNERWERIGLVCAA